MTFDLSSLKLKETTSVHLRHPVTDELLYKDEEKTLPIEAIIYGKASKKYRTAILALQNRAIARKGKASSAEAMQEESIQLLVSCSESIQNLDVDGTPFDSTPDSFKKLYTTPGYSWLKDQIDEGVGSNTAFLEQ